MEKNAFDVLMENARTRGSSSRKRPLSSFSCPAGCGAWVTASDVNDHLDRCLGGGGSSVVDVVAVIDPRAGRRDRADDGNPRDRKRGRAGGTIDGGGARRSSPAAVANTGREDSPGSGDAFSRMMERSATVFFANKSVRGDENIIRHRFHLHDAEGRVTWTSIPDDGSEENKAPPNFATTGADEIAELVDHIITYESIPPEDSAHNMIPASTISIGETNWSAVVMMKKVKCATSSDERDDGSIDDNDSALELTMSSSLPSSSRDDGTCRLVRTHSRLSVSQLKSCLQKSIRRRAPLPAIRVAMELVDRSWCDLIRRLPIIVLEDSTLHPDFGLLVWLMVAESKGFFPCMGLLKKVLQVVFEMASCARQDNPSEVGGIDKSDHHNLRLSLKSPTSRLFPRRHTAINSCEVLIRSMLLRAQYGGMKCDVRMLHSYAMTWLKRFRSMVVSSSALDALALDLPSRPIFWWDIPGILHENAREKSAGLVTSAIVCVGGLPKLTLADVCHAGIDFHCSSVVGHLVSQREVISSLWLAPPKDRDRHEWMAGQIKSMIWKYSSGINHRRMLLSGAGADDMNVDDPNLKAVWENVIRSSFECYTKKFVVDRLA